jgi:hypothetical protein
MKEAMSNLTPEQAALGNAAVLYSFGQGASIHALSVVYEISEDEVVELIRTGMNNLMKAAITAKKEGARVERQACIQAALDERLTDDTGHPEDIAYNKGIADVIESIRERGEQPEKGK